MWSAKQISISWLSKHYHLRHCLSVCEIHFKVEIPLSVIWFVFDRRWSCVFVKLDTVDRNVAVGWCHTTVLHARIRRFSSSSTRCCYNLVGEWSTDTSWQSHLLKILFTNRSHCFVNSPHKRQLWRNLWVCSNVQRTEKLIWSHSHQCSRFLHEMHPFA